MEMRIWYSREGNFWIFRLVYFAVLFPVVSTLGYSRVSDFRLYQLNRVIFEVVEENAFSQALFLHPLWAHLFSEIGPELEDLLLQLDPCWESWGTLPAKSHLGQVGLLLFVVGPPYSVLHWPFSAPFVLLKGHHSHLLSLRCENSGFISVNSLSWLEDHSWSMQDISNKENHDSESR